MVFTITRASQWEGQPCKEAVLMPVPEGYDSSYEVWSVEFNSMDDLMSFVARERRVVIGHNSHQVDGMPYMTIYDDYLE